MAGVKRYKAWAAVGKKSGKVLRDGNGQYGIYAIRPYAEADCPRYGYVDQVTITVRKRK